MTTAELRKAETRKSPAIGLTPGDLARAESRYKLAARRADNAREERNMLVRAALAAGWTHARISEATGLSRGRISQIKS